MRYVVVVNGRTLPMREISVGEMTWLLGRTKTFKLVGVPFYYDADGRFFPEPGLDCEVRDVDKKSRA